jgi:hypothetical protein
MSWAQICPQKKFRRSGTYLKLTWRGWRLSYLLKINKTKVTKIQMPISSIFKPETFFWCQKFCLDLLSSEHVSENCLEVGNILKINLERYGDFRWLTATYGNFVFVKKNKKINNKINKEKPTSSIFKLETFPWCQKFRLDLLISNLSSEKF